MKMTKSEKECNDLQKVVKGCPFVILLNAYICFWEAIDMSRAEPMYIP